jgi:membrane-associated phospholipid phosphatase
MDVTKYEARAVPFAVTFCKHLPGDRVGGFACLLSLAPIFVLISLGTLLLSRRDPATLLFIAGLIASTLFNDYLKLVIKEPRPCSDTHYCSLSEGDVYGMPSGHTQFQAFAAAYISLWALSGRWREPSALLRWAVVAGCWASVACVGSSRLYLHYHTLRQVAVGGALGVVLATLWFFGVEGARPLFGYLAGSALGRWLMIRDCSEVDTLRVEYEAVVIAAKPRGAEAAAARAQPAGQASGERRSDSPAASKNSPTAQPPAAAAPAEKDKHI